MNSSEQQSQPIWTLQARDSVMLEVIASMGGYSDAQMQQEILAAHGHTIQVLADKGVDYGDLRTALVPQQKRAELALAFDRAQIPSNWYGLEAASRVIAGLPRQLSCCLLHGDLIIEDQDIGISLLERFLLPVREVTIGHTNQLYCIYLNNLSKKMKTRSGHGPVANRRCPRVDKRLDLLPSASYTADIELDRLQNLKEITCATVNKVK